MEALRTARRGRQLDTRRELHNVTTALKHTIAARTIQVDLDIDLDIDLSPTRPTDLFTDAQAVLDGKGGVLRHGTPRGEQ